MGFPTISNGRLLQLLELPTGKVRMALDTDTFNEIDDQFALAYALKSTEKLIVEAVYAALFYNNRSSGLGDGMEKSYEEILNVLKLLDIHSDGLVFHGSNGYLKGFQIPQDSEAARDLIKRAMECKNELLYVVAISVLTNIASVILMEPKIIEKIVVAWIGGHAFSWPYAKEFNLEQDIHASRIIFDCGVPLIHIPLLRSYITLLTTVPELEYYLMGKSKIGAYLTDIVKSYTDEPYGWSKVIWDIAVIAWLINPEYYCRVTLLSLSMLI